MDRRYKILKMTPELVIRLLPALAVPEGTELVDVLFDAAGRVNFKLSHPSFPPPDDGGWYPDVVYVEPDGGTDADQPDIIEAGGPNGDPPGECRRPG